MIKLVWEQFEAKLMIFYDMAFCFLLSSLVGADDLRIFLIWTALFPGVVLVIFSGSLQFQSANCSKAAFLIWMVCLE